MASPRSEIPRAPKPFPTSPAQAAARALVSAGLLEDGERSEAAEVIKVFLVPSVLQYPFSTDAEFLHQSISHHLAVYFRTILEPVAKSHHRGTAGQGKLMSDADIEKACSDLSLLIAGELGQGYTSHMSKYFGTGDGLVSYIFSRVNSMLMEEALKYNESFLKSMRVRVRTEEATAALMRGTV
jgi:hypothetical protein